MNYLLFALVGLVDGIDKFVEKYNPLQLNFRKIDCENKLMINERPLRLKEIWLTAVILLAAVAFSHAQDCHSFKEGNFAYAAEEHKDWHIERVGEYQLEHSEKHDVLFVASLEWTDECSYLLQYVSVSNPKYFDAYGKLLKCEVIPISNERYEIVVDDEGEILTYIMERTPEEKIVDGTVESPVK